MAAALIDQWIAVHGPVAKVTFGNGPLAENSPDSVQATTSSRFRARSIMAAVNAAVAISNEAIATPNHVLRAQLSKNLLNAPDSYIFPMAQALAAQGLDDSSTDTAINNGVASVWNSFA